MCIEMYALIIDIITLIIDIIILVVLFLSVSLLYWQIWKEHKWNRCKAAQDINFQISQGDLFELRKKLNEYAKDFYSEETYGTVISTLEDKEKTDLNHILRTYLSYLEGVALGIKQKIYEDKIMFDYLGSALPEICRWSMPFIEDKRIKAKDKTIYIEITKLAEKWNKRNKEHQNT